MKRLLIIDANALIHRAYHALPGLKTKKGELVNAVYGFLLAFFKAVREFSPDFICACFDLPGPTFRHLEYKEYKATRPKTPSELHEQIPKVKQVLEAFDVSIFEKQGFEADDIVGTLASQAANKSEILWTRSGLPGGLHSKLQTKEGLETIVLSGDLDLLQLADDNTKVYVLNRGVKNAVLYDKDRVQERYGLSPILMPDFKALVGDASDNIPGVPGIGPKTAAKLLQEFGSLEGIYEKFEILNSKLQTNSKFEISKKLMEKLIEYKEQAVFSKELARVRDDVPIDFDLEKCAFGDYNKEKAKEVLREFEFYSLIKRLPGEDRKNEGKVEKTKRLI